MQQRRLSVHFSGLPDDLQDAELHAVPPDYLHRLAPYCDGRELLFVAEQLSVEHPSRVRPSHRQRAYRCRRRAMDAGAIPFVPLPSLRLAYRLGRLRLPPGVDPYTPPPPTPGGS